MYVGKFIPCRKVSVYTEDGAETSRHNNKGGQMKLAEQKVEWNDPGDPSVVKHKIYYVPEAEAVSYLSPNVVIDMPALSYDLPGLPIAPKPNGENYRLRLTAVDGVGNESDFSPEKLLPLDFIPPSMPSWKE